jgi:hypothetical protein
MWGKPFARMTHNGERLIHRLRSKKGKKCPSLSGAFRITVDQARAYTLMTDFARPCRHCWAFGELEDAIEKRWGNRFRKPWQKAPDSSRVTL